MLERTLKNISDLGYNIFWRYEPSSNAIIIRVQKDNYAMDQRVDLDIDMRIGGDVGFAFYMNRYLIGLLCEIEKREKQ